MERISNVVTFQTKALQTDPPDNPLELMNPINAPLLVPLKENGFSFANGVDNWLPAALDEHLNGVNSDPEEIPEGVEIIQPARAPADGVYRFGMGGLNLLTIRKKKRNYTSNIIVKKKKKENGAPKSQRVLQRTILNREAMEASPEPQPVSILKNIGLAMQTKESSIDMETSSANIPRPKTPVAIAPIMNQSPPVKRPEPFITTRSAKRGITVSRSEIVDYKT